MKKPSKIAQLGLKITNRGKNRDIVLGDFNEFYSEVYKESGGLQADYWYWMQLFKSIPRFIWTTIYWRIVMLKNYLKVAIRNIRTNKTYAFINIIGLAIGMAVFFLISVWVLDELSFDRFNAFANRIYRVCTDVRAGSQMRLAMTMPPLKDAILQDLPEVQTVVRIGYPTRRQVKVVDDIFQEDLVGYADKDLFNVFSFTLIRGNQNTALEAPNTLVITQSMAKKYFGEEDPLGKMLKIGGNSEYTITGIVEDVPVNSHFRFNMLMSYETLYSENQAAMEYWMHIQFYTYILLVDGADPKVLEDKFPSLVEARMGTMLKSIGGSLDLFLQPITRIHLHSHLLGEISANGSMIYVIIFSGIAFLILTIACINFINLSTARSTVRAREVGMRKTFGAHKSRLVAQFLGESFFYSLLSLIIAIQLWLLIKPMFQSLIGRELGVHIIKDIWILPGFLGLTLFTGLAAGSYPAFYLSSFLPVRVLKTKLSEVQSNGRLRKILVVFQFSVSVFLIIGTIAIYQQIHYMKNRDLGMNKENVVVIPGMVQLVRERSLETIREEFLQLPGVINVAGCFLMPSRSVGKGIYYPEGFSEDLPQTTNRMSIDAYFIPTLGMEIVAGRNFSDNLSSEQSESLIINEVAARSFGWSDPIGKTIRLKDPRRLDSQMINKRVVGMVKDFHSLSLQRPIEPTVISYNTAIVSDLSIRITPENISHTLNLIEQKWQELAQDSPFDYFFLDDSFDMSYRNEERIGRITLYFSALAIFIGCLGLFGLIAFIAEKRSKEIGIRKVLGASVQSIVVLLSKEFILLVVIANLISWPLAYFSLNRWLQNFAYRMHIQWPMFVLAGFLALLLGLLTIVFQTVKAACANPVDAIQYE